MKDIDADYYGYRDEDDGLIAPLEQEAEKKGMVKIYQNHPMQADNSILTRSNCLVKRNCQKNSFR